MSEELIYLNIYLLYAYWHYQDFFIILNMQLTCYGPAN